jgi:hypothetical protein
LNSYIINIQDHPLGNTPLHYAAMNGHIEAVIELINAGANPRVENYKGANCLVEACLNLNISDKSCFNKDIIDLLIKGCPDLLLSINSLKESTLESILRISLYAINERNKGTTTTNNNINNYINNKKKNINNDDDSKNNNNHNNGKHNANNMQDTQNKYNSIGLIDTRYIISYSHTTPVLSYILCKMASNLSIRHDNNNYKLIISKFIKKITSLRNIEVLKSVNNLNNLYNNNNNNNVKHLYKDIPYDVILHADTSEGEEGKDNNNNSNNNNNDNNTNNNNNNNITPQKSSIYAHSLVLNHSAKLQSMIQFQTQVTKQLNDEDIDNVDNNINDGKYNGDLNQRSTIELSLIGISYFYLNELVIYLVVLLNLSFYLSI